MAKEDRKGRRINYSRKELAEYLHCAETSVDYRLKKYLIITISWIVHRSKKRLIIIEIFFHQNMLLY